MNRGLRAEPLAGAAMLMLALTGCAAESAAVPDPPAEGNVLDAAGILTEEQEQSLDALIEDRNAATGAARVAVLTVEDADGSIEDYAREVATTWGVGEEDANNGVLVVADTEERELRIETAEGVRESFSDDEAEDVVEDVLEPAFADERYAQGLTEAVDHIYRYAQGQDMPQEPFPWVLVGGVTAGLVALTGLFVTVLVRDSRRRRRLVDEEIRAAEQRDPDLRLTEEQREAYHKYRHAHRGDDAVSDPAVWLPLHLANPALYSGNSTGARSADGSSFGGGGGFTGGGASGSY